MSGTVTCASPFTSGVQSGSAGPSIRATQASACPHGLVPSPTIVLPSAETPFADSRVHPVSLGVTSSSNTLDTSRIPSTAVQTKARRPSAMCAYPTTTDPFADVARAILLESPPSKSPSPTSPPASVQRNASTPGPSKRYPTTTSPSLETACASVADPGGGVGPIGINPPTDDHRTAWVLPAVLQNLPTITLPSAESHLATSR